MPKNNDRGFTAEETRSRDEARARHRRKARRTAIRRLVIFLIVLVLGFLAWRYWDVVNPKTLAEKLQSELSGSIGEYPIDISGTNVARIAVSDNCIVTVDDSHVIFYDKDGGEVNRTTCVFADPLVRTAGKYTLLASQGSKRVQLLTRSATLLDLTMTQDVLTVALNSKGQFAVLMQGGQGYSVELAVYNRKGKLLYTRSRTRLATDVALSPNGSTVALISTDTAGGTLTGTVEVFSLSSNKEAIYSYTTDSALLYKLAYFDNGKLVAVGEDGALFIDPSKATTVPYSVNTQRVLSCAFGSHSIALVLREYGDTDGGKALLLTDGNTVAASVDFAGEYRYLTAKGDRFLLLTDSQIIRFEKTGNPVSAAVNADGQQAVLSNDRAIVLGINSIQAYTID